MRILLLALVNGEITLQWKGEGQGHWEQKCSIEIFTAISVSIDHLPQSQYYGISTIWRREITEIMDSFPTDTVLCHSTIAVSDTLHLAAAACTSVQGSSRKEKGTGTQGSWRAVASL